MKNWIIVFFSFLFMQVAAAQQDKVSQAKRTGALPPLELLQVDSTMLTKESLRKNVPVIIMFFSPDCDHCKKQVDEMVKRMSDLKKYQIVMATYQPIEELKTFNKNYELAKYPNIKTGRDIKYLLPPFYQIGPFPFFALYDRKGKLLTTFEGNIKVDTLLKPFSRQL